MPKPLCPQTHSAAFSVFKGYLIFLPAAFSQAKYIAPTCKPFLAMVSLYHHGYTKTLLTISYVPHRLNSKINYTKLYLWKNPEAGALGKESYTHISKKSVSSYGTKKKERKNCADARQKGSLHPMK